MRLRLGGIEVKTLHGNGEALEVVTMGMVSQTAPLQRSFPQWADLEVLLWEKSSSDTRTFKTL